MRIIDLLDNIANNKDLPERIKFDNEEFKLNKQIRNYFDDCYHIDYINWNGTKLFTDYTSHYIVNFLKEI